MIDTIYAVEIDSDNGGREMWTNKPGTEIHCATSLLSARQMIVTSAPFLGDKNPKIIKYRKEAEWIIWLK